MECDWDWTPAKDGKIKERMNKEEDRKLKVIGRIRKLILYIFCNVCVERIATSHNMFLFYHVHRAQ